MAKTDVRKIFDRVQRRYPQYGDPTLTDFFNEVRRDVSKKADYNYLKFVDQLAVAEDTSLTGTCTFVFGSTAVTGSGTAFSTELRAGDYVYLLSADASLTGTVTFTSGSTAVTGVGSAFTSELTTDDFVYLEADGVAYQAKISGINSDTSLTLSTAYGGTGGAGTAIREGTTNSGLSYRQMVQSITSDTALVLSDEYTGTSGSGTGKRDRTRYLLSDVNTYTKNVISVSTLNGGVVPFQFQESKLIFDATDITTQTLLVTNIHYPAEMAVTAIDIASGDTGAFTFEIPAPHRDIIEKGMKRLCEIDTYENPKQFVLQEYVDALSDLIDDYVGGDYSQREIDQSVQNSDGTYVYKF